MDTTYSLKLPPKNYRRIIEELSVTIPDPVLKLKFLKQAINEYQKISSQGNLNPPKAGGAFQKKLLDNAEELWPGSKNAAKNLIRKDVITIPDIKSKWRYKLRYVIGSAIVMFFILGVGTAFSPLIRSFNPGARISPNTQQAKPPNTKIIIRKSIRYSQPSNGGENPPSFIVKSVNSQNEAEPVLKQLRNPILLALTTSQQTKNSQTDPGTRKPLLSSPAPKSQIHWPSSIAKPAKSQNGPGLVLKCFQNPILMALNSQKAIHTKSDHISQKPVSFSQPHVGVNLQTLTANSSPEIQLIERQTPLTYFQSPILMALTSQPFISSKLNRIPQKPMLSSRPPEGQKHSSTPSVKIINYQIEPEQVPEYLQHPIWLVEKTSDREIYSNRLQIITTHTISNLPREYYRFPKNSNPLPVNCKIADKISGIVYHASESDLYPFMPEMNHSILKYSKQLIKYLLRKKSYNFFIDRFGRVYRLVREDHAAFHAGNSIWADESEIYLNLNHAFIGICFEGKDFEEIKISRQQTDSNPARLKPTGISSFNEAQLRSGKELTDWLRIKYNIPQHNCVPHALISVNPDKMLIGFHLDLARGFPFARFGLSDKYQEPLPSIVEFGFVYDNYFAKIFNGELWRGIRYSEEILERQAGNAGMSFAVYRKSLQRKFYRYREWNEEMLEKKDQLVIEPQ